MERVLKALEARFPSRMVPDLDRIRDLLDILGSPQRSFPSIHVTGTNGKTSTARMADALLREFGPRTGRYTSPHLHDVTERIALDGEPLDADRFVATYDDIAPYLELVDGRHADRMTFFEVLTGMAFAAFAEAPIDVGIIEVGLGGRWDATNVIDAPVAVVTPIGLDHMQFLGDTIEAIAAEKAAIAKPGVPMVVAPQLSAAAVSVLTRDIESAGAPLHLAGRDWSVAPAPDGFVLRTAAGDRAYPRPALPGDHQFANAATAIRLRDLLAGFDIPEEAVRSGLAAVEWPARLQRLTRGPLAGLLPPGWELWLDGGHNDSAGEVLGQWLGGLDKRPLHLVCGMLESKQPQEFLRPLAPFVRSIRTVRIPGEEASLPAEAVADHARAVGLTDVATAEDVTAAVAAAARPGDPPGRVLICGSLYLAGRVLAANG